MQDDGNLVIYATDNSWIWRTNTVGHGAPPPPAPPPPPDPPPPPPGWAELTLPAHLRDAMLAASPIETGRLPMLMKASLPPLDENGLPPLPPPPSGAALLPPAPDGEFALGGAQSLLELELSPPQSMYAKPATPGAGYWQQFFYANDIGTGTRGYFYAPLTGQGFAGASFDYTGIGKVEAATDGAASYVVRGGETLRDVARSLYGDETLWYVIAQANGLTAPDGLAAGTTLKIPSVTRASNTASTFKVYNAGEAIGSTAPDQIAPPPPPGKEGGCGGVGKLLIVVVAVVATVYTAGAASIYFGAGSGMGATALGAASVGEIFAAGAAALGGGGVVGVGAAAGVATPLTITGGVAATGAALGGAVGSIAGQAVGIATGVQDEFSWKSVGLAALGAAVTSGIGALSGGAAAGNNASFLGIAKTDNAMLYAAARGVTNSLVTQGLGSALGLQSFSWKAIAVSAITAPLNAAINKDMLDPLLDGKDSFFRDSVTGIVNGTLAQSVRMQVYSDGKVDWASIAADAFGNAIGNGIVSSTQPSTSASASPFNYRDNDGDYQLPLGYVTMDADSTTYGQAADHNGVKPLDPSDWVTIGGHPAAMVAGGAIPISLFGTSGLASAGWSGGLDADGNPTGFDLTRGNALSDPRGEWRESMAAAMRRANALQQITTLEEFRSWSESRERPQSAVEGSGLFDRRLPYIADAKDFLLSRINEAAANADPATQLGLKVLGFGVHVITPSTEGDAALFLTAGPAGKAVAGAGAAVLGITARHVDDLIEAVVKEGGDVGRALRSGTGRGLIDESNKLFRQYIRQMEDAAGIQMSALQREDLFKAVRKVDLTAHPPAASVDAVKLQHADEAFRAQMRSKWSKRYGQEWPTYRENVYTADGELYRRAGRPLEMHHINFKAAGGTNDVWNYFPSPWPQHQRLLHGTGSSGEILHRRLERGRSGS
jgi:hypothetical protein